MTVQPSIRTTLATGLLLASCQLAHAATVSTSSYFSMSDSVSTGANVGAATDNLGASDYVLLNGFDSALGTLNSVTLEYYSVSNSSRAYADFRDDDWLQETSGLTRLQGMQLSSSFLGTTYYRSRNNRSATCSDSGGVTTVASCRANISSSTVYWTDQSTLITSGGVLASLTDVANVSVGIHQSGSLYSVETDGDDGYITNRYGLLSSSGYIKLTYDYTAVPVPAAAWMFGSALLGLVSVGRKRA